MLATVAVAAAVKEEVEVIVVVWRRGCTPLTGGRGGGW